MKTLGKLIGLDYHQTKIEVYAIDDMGKEADNCYKAVLMGYNGGWYDTGIASRNEDATTAFNNVVTRAKEKGWWK